MNSNMMMNVQTQFCVLFVRIIMLLRITEGNNINSLSSTNVTHKPSESGCEGGTLLSAYVCIPQGYLVGEVPEIPTTVNTRIEINNILEVNDKKMRITLDFYQELLWVDDRIKTLFPLEHPNKMSVLNNNLIDHIWKPDLWIQNLFEYKLHGILVPTGGLVIKAQEPSSLCESAVECTNYTTKEPTTLVTYNMEAQTTIHCNFYFVNYPMDTQICEFVMDVSYPYPDIVKLSFELGLFGFTMKNANIDDFDITVQFEDRQNQTGVHAVIKLDRSILPYIIKCYLPCIAIITVSLISFLISIDSVPARVGLLVTQFLTVTNILIAQQAESPSSGKFTALGMYLLASLFFVVAAFIEFACVLQMERYNGVAQIISGETTRLLKNGDITTTTIVQQDYDKRSNSNIDQPRFDLRKIDRIAFVVGGLMFLLFNLVYWFVFLIFDLN